MTPGPVFLLGFLPALVAGGLVLLYAQPDSGSFGARWASDLGFAYLADDLEAVVLPIAALVIRLAFGVTFDTSGRRVAADEAVVASDRRDDASDRRDYAPEDADEPTLAERRAVAPGEVDRDRDGVPDRDEVRGRGQCRGRLAAKVPTPLRQAESRSRLHRRRLSLGQGSTVGALAASIAAPCRRRSSSRKTE